MEIDTWQKRLKISILIPTHNGYEILKNCIDSVFNKTTYADYEIIIIDNRSNDAHTIRYLDQLNSEFSNIQVLSWNKPFNFSAMNNYAVSCSKGEMLCLLNNDTEVISPGWLEEMMKLAVSEDIGCVGALLFYPDDTVQHAGVVLGVNGVADHIYKNLPKSELLNHQWFHSVQVCSAVTAACLFVRKKVYLQVGGMDEKNLPVAYNDVDFCLNLEAVGFKNLWTPNVQLYHHESKTRKKIFYPLRKLRLRKEKHYMKKKWGTKLRSDPYFPVLKQ